MKTLYKIIVLTLIAATGLLAAGCRDCPTNGKLDNQWQIMTIEYPDGTVQQPQKLYYCFYRDIVQLTTGGVVATANLARVLSNSPALCSPWKSTTSPTAPSA